METVKKYFRGRICQYKNRYGNNKALTKVVGITFKYDSIAISSISKNWSKRCEFDVKMCQNYICFLFLKKKEKDITLLFATFFKQKKNYSNMATKGMFGLGELGKVDTILCINEMDNQKIIENSP